MSDPHNELSALALGLAAEIERRQSRGERHTQAPAVPVPARDALPETYAVAAQCSNLASLAQAVAACRACPLGASRQGPACASGTPDTSAQVQVLMLASSPGADEEASGLPMAGKSGQLLADIITKGMRMELESVHITQLVKCRPPADREPSPSEKATCSAFLERELELLNPKLILALGARAAEHLLKEERIGPEARGRVHEVQGRKVIPTFHPAFLLENPGKKSDCWQDIKVALGEL